MSQIFSKSLEEVVNKRTSVRTYSTNLISNQEKEQLNTCINTLSNPFSTKITFHMLETQNTEEYAQIGTYGMIKGAKDYIGATAENTEFCYFALGYEFEKLILFAASIGLGTCWLGGTFKKSAFAEAMQIKEGEIFPAVSPIGYASDKKRLAETMTRFVIKADKRKPWKDIFFNGDFTKPLTSDEAEEYQFPLEMLRLGPSASNKQPWRIVKDNANFHFYENKTPGYSDRLGYDIQKIDMGIAACHFHLAAIEKNIAGELKRMPSPISVIPQNCHYVFSWVTN